MEPRKHLGVNKNGITAENVYLFMARKLDLLELLKLLSTFDDHFLVF